MRWKTIISLTLSFFLGVGLTVFVLKTDQFFFVLPQSSFKTSPTLRQPYDGSSEGNKKASISTYYNYSDKLEKVKITRVIDGDTIETADGRRIRYIGIDTPETSDPRKPVECFGREATAKNSDLLLGKEVLLEKDVSETDKYDRLLRYVWILLPDRGEVMVNEILVKEGYGFVVTFPPDVKYQERFLAAQRQAQAEGKGLWSGCRITQTPEVNTGAKSIKIDKQPVTNGSVYGEKYTLGAETDCIIKGNISRKGEKIYHLPGCGSYDKTVIDESKGEHWFCTGDEAVKAGWRKAKNC